MGRYSQTVAANSFGSEVHDLGSSKAHHVRISTTEDRGGAKGALGGVPSGEEEEGGLVAWGACCGECAAGFLYPYKQKRGTP